MSLSGKTFAITGTLILPRKTIVDVIITNGGAFAATVSKKCTHLICADPNTKNRAKLDKAEAMGVQIVGEDFLTPYLNSKIDGKGKEEDDKNEVEMVSSKKAKISIEEKKTTKTEIAQKPKKTVEKKKSADKKKKPDTTTKIQVREGEKNIIEEVDEFLALMKESNSNLDKKNVFKQYVELASEEFSSLIKMIYTKQLKFHITPKNVAKYEMEKYTDKTVPTFKNVSVEFLEFITNLVESELTGHDALKVAVSYLKAFPQYRDTLLTIYDKDLKIRFGLSLVNDAIPDFVKVFNVSLGAAYNDKTKKCTDEGKWFISKKLDGVRCILMMKCDENGELLSVEGYSRGGLKFGTLSKVQEEVKKHWKSIYSKVSHLGNEFVLDGEMCVIKEDGSEDFTAIVSEIKRKDTPVKNPRFLVFDLLTVKEFEDEVSPRIFSQRIDILRQLFPSYETNLKQFVSVDSRSQLNSHEQKTIETNMIQMLPQLPFTEEMFGAMSIQAEKQNWEGLMLRKDAPYQGKRSNDLLKVKQFETEEYKVRDVVFGPIMIINEDTGLQQTVEALVSVIIDHKGPNNVTNEEDTKEINVGSGFSQAERIEYHNHPEKIKGMVISVQFFEHIYSSDGKQSLRFPTFKGLHGKKREL